MVKVCRADEHSMFLVTHDGISVILDRPDKVYSRDGNFSRANIELSQKMCHQLGILKQVYPFEDIVAPIAR